MSAGTRCVGRHPLERHHGHRAGILGDLRLLGVDDVHDHAALEHLRHPALDPGGAGVLSHGNSCSWCVSTGSSCVLNRGAVAEIGVL